MDRTDRTENIPGTSRVMYTPRTPRIRERQRFDFSTNANEDEDIDISVLEVLVGQTWNIYAVSALFGIQQDDIHLKLYSKRLREEIASTLSREDVTYDANFSLIEDLISIPNHENHPAIKIDVSAKTSTQETDVVKSIYKGILLCWRVTQIEPNMQNAIRLPLLLCRGTRSCMDAVHTIISCMFDCLVIALPAKEDDLSWILPIMIMSNNKEEQSAISGEVHMIYTVPELPITNTITVKFKTTDLRKILTAIVTNQNENTINSALNREHIETFYEILHTQMLTIGGLQLGLCTLHRINLPGTTILENKMKITNVEILNHILLYLNEKAFDTFHTIHIDV